MKIAVMSVAISDVYFSAFEWISACKETSYVKVSKSLQMMNVYVIDSFFFFEGVVITIN